MRLWRRHDLHATLCRRLLRRIEEWRGPSQRTGTIQRHRSHANGHVVQIVRIAAERTVEDGSAEGGAEGARRGKTTDRPQVNDVVVLIARRAGVRAGIVESQQHIALGLSRCNARQTESGQQSCFVQMIFHIVLF